MPDEGVWQMRETSADGIAWGERHLQCIWSDERFRPREMRTTDGRPVRVLSAGEWNGGPGPDFRNALLEIGGRRVRGDVEIHIRPGDWFAHGHGDDPEYGAVALHVAWFAPRGGVALPGVPHVALCDAMRAQRGFSFDQIDVGAYPWGGGAASGRPCRDAFRGAPPDRIHALLEAAGRIRAARRAREVASRAVIAESPAQAFYEEIMAALGWRGNEGAMRALARLVPLSRLEESDTAEERYALLVGTAGLLPKTAGASAWAAKLWDAAFRAGATEKPVGTIRWKLGAMRPANHPRVRLAAAAAMFGGAPPLRPAVFSIPRDDPAKWVKAAQKVFSKASAPGALLLPQSASGARPPSPLGVARIDAMLASAVVPALMAEDPDALRLLDAIPGEDVGSAMKATATRLFGPDHNAALLYGASALRTQGLLELWRGRCRAAPEECAGCPLATRQR